MFSHALVPLDIKLSTRFDLLNYYIITDKMFEMLNILHVKTENFIVLKSTDNDQKTSSSKLSQISLNI